jgi:hypothetical protein
MSDRGRAMTLHEGLIWTMVLASAADRNLSRAEQKRLRDVVGHLPVFDGFDARGLGKVCEACARTLIEDNGIDRAARLIKKAIPRRFGETAYVLACDIIAADRRVGDNEIGVLDLLAELFGLDSLTCAALEAAARARYVAQA